MAILISLAAVTPKPEAGADADRDRGIAADRRRPSAHGRFFNYRRRHLNRRGRNAGQCARYSGSGVRRAQRRAHRDHHPRLALR